MVAIVLIVMSAWPEASASSTPDARCAPQKELERRLLELGVRLSEGALEVRLEPNEETVRLEVLKEGTSVLRRALRGSCDEAANAAVIIVGRFLRALPVPQSTGAEPAVPSAPKSNPSAAVAAPVVKRRPIISGTDRGSSHSAGRGSTTLSAPGPIKRPAAEDSHDFPTSIESQSTPSPGIPTSEVDAGTSWRTLEPSLLSVAETDRAGGSPAPPTKVTRAPPLARSSAVAPASGNSAVAGGSREKLASASDAIERTRPTPRAAALAESAGQPSPTSTGPSVGEGEPLAVEAQSARNAAPGLVLTGWQVLAGGGVLAGTGMANGESPHVSGLIRLSGGLLWNDRWRGGLLGLFSFGGATTLSADSLSGTITTSDFLFLPHGDACTSTAIRICGGVLAGLRLSVGSGFSTTGGTTHPLYRLGTHVAPTFTAGLVADATFRLGRLRTSVSLDLLTTPVPVVFEIQGLEPRVSTPQIEGVLALSFGLGPK